MRVSARDAQLALCYSPLPEHKAPPNTPLPECLTQPLSEPCPMQSSLYKRKQEYEGVHVVFKYYVPPSKADDFVDNWRKMEDKASGEKHLTTAVLHKTMEDNVVFIGYGEWEDEEAFRDLEYLEGEDIPLRWQLVNKLTGDVNKYKDNANASESFSLLPCNLVLMQDDTLHSAPCSAELLMKATCFLQNVPCSS
jgi:Antibiotic biosynthesis monooxygenase